MPKPIVAVVGRPNVGKSTLVNRLAVTREAIVHESRGVTRDRSYHDCDWNGRTFTLVDTGGIESAKSKDAFAPRIRDQAVMACNEADVIIFVVDGTVGVTDEDEEVARVVRTAKKPVFLVVNKIDDPEAELESWNYYSLGVGEPRAISAGHGHGTGDLLDDVVTALREDEGPAEQDDALRLAIIGRPNVGKSSLANRLAKSNRFIVADLSGTTRDAVDTMISWKGQRLRLVDTAGMRKKAQVHEDVEYYSLVRGLEAMDRADVCLLVVDATVGVTEQDQKLVGMAVDRGCGLVTVLNKWDLVDSAEKRDKVTQSLDQRMGFAAWAPVVTTSALTGRSIDRVLTAATKAAAAHGSRVKTSQLNALITRIRESGYTVTRKNRRLKVRYGTQTATKPPVFTLWCNAPNLVDDNYERFLERRLRKTFDLEGTPIRLRFRRRDDPK